MGAPVHVRHPGQPRSAAAGQQRHVLEFVPAGIRPHRELFPRRRARAELHVFRRHRPHLALRRSRGPRHSQRVQSLSEVRLRRCGDDSLRDDGKPPAELRQQPVSRVHPRRQHLPLGRDAPCQAQRDDRDGRQRVGLDPRVSGRSRQRGLDVRPRARRCPTAVRRLLGAERRSRPAARAGRFRPPVRLRPLGRIEVASARNRLRRHPPLCRGGRLHGSRRARSQQPRCRLHLDRR